jgi:hypothetical protein
MAVEPKYFYYYDSVAGTFTEFTPKYEYENGNLRFTIEKGGIIIATPQKIA